jgi:hypothetical protein
MPSSVIHTFAAPDAYFAGMRNLQIEGLVTRRGEFRGEANLIDLPRVLMCRFDENLSRIMKVSPSGRRAGILFATNPDQPAMLMNGAEILQGQIARAGLHWEWYLRSPGPCEWATMSLTPEDLAAAGEAIIGHELVPPSFVHGVTPPPTALLRLRKLHEAAGHLAKTAPEILVKPEVARAIEHALVEAMVFCLPTPVATRCAMYSVTTRELCGVWRRR